jgi:hypothetical protein
MANGAHYKCAVNYENKMKEVLRKQAEEEEEKRKEAEANFDWDAYMQQMMKQREE